MKKKNVLTALVTILAASSMYISTTASAAETPGDYIALKAGIYSPSKSYHLDTFNNGNRDNLDSKTGFAGEIAVGHYFLPMLALELGGGYFESKGSPAAAACGRSTSAASASWC